MSQELGQTENKGSLTGLTPIEIDEVLDYIRQLEKEIEELVFEKE